MPIGSKLLHGAAVLCYVNGYLVGRITHFRYSYSVGIKEIDGLDFPMPFELAETFISVSGSMRLLKISGDGGTQGMGILPQVNEVPRLKYSTLVIVDRNTGTALFKSDFCRITEESWDVPNKGLVEGSVSFKAISFSNEMANSTLFL